MNPLDMEAGLPLKEVKKPRDGGVAYKEIRHLNLPLYVVPDSRRTSRGRDTRKLFRKKCINVCVAICVILLLVLSVAQLLYTYSVDKGLEERIKQEVQSRLLAFQAEGKDLSSLLQTNIVEAEDPLEISQRMRSKRTSDKGKKKGKKKGKRKGKKCKKKEKACNGKERPERSQFQPSVFVHLRGTTDRPMYDGDGENLSFRWAKPTDRSLSRFFDFLPTTNVISRIRIKQDGTYMVYSQVVVHGRRSNVHPHSCAHRTIRKHGEGEETLMKSLVTQFNLGLNFSDSGSNVVYPLDSKLQMGVFRLQAGDELRVGLVEHCHNHNYYMDAENSYFGLLKVGM